MFLEQKNVQSVFLDFHAKLDQLVKAEMKQNREQLQSYLNLPHSQDISALKPAKISARLLDGMPKEVQEK